MIRWKERDVDARRSVAPSGTIRQRERQARHSVINLSLTLVLINGLSCRRFRVVVRQEEREKCVGRLRPFLISRGAAADRSFDGSGWQLSFSEDSTTLN